MASAGPISLIADRLALMLQATHIWSSLGATLHHHHLPPPANRISHTAPELAALRPFVLIWTDDRQGIQWTRDTPGPDACSSSAGTLLIRYERNTPAGLDPAAAARDFENSIGQLCKGTAAEPGLIDLAGDPRYLPLVALELIEHSRTVPEKITAIGDCQRAFLAASWATS